MELLCFASSVFGVLDLSFRYGLALYYNLCV